MNWIQQNKQYLIISALAMLMALTRSDHFGSAITLPDASLAVFFFAGIFACGISGFILLMAEAALLDYIAIAFWQVSDYCISPAYVMLIPTYAVMYYAGLRSIKFAGTNFRDLSLCATYLLGAATLAFLISNGSFYLLSGKFPELSVMHYAQSVARYYPAYVSSTLIYSLVILLFTKFVQTFYIEKYTAA